MAFKGHVQRDWWRAGASEAEPRERPATDSSAAKPTLARALKSYEVVRGQ